jgi:hypothetical protein
VIGDDYLEIVSRMRLPDADRRWKAWLEEHGLELSDFHGDEIEQYVIRGGDGNRIPNSAIGAAKAVA